MAEVKNGRPALRALAGYCFSPLFGLRRALPDFAGLHVSRLKASVGKVDRGDFPCKTRFPRSLRFNSPLSTRNFLPTLFRLTFARLLYLLCAAGNSSCGCCLVIGWSGHLHGPDGGWAHVHGGAEVSGVVPGFGGAEPIAFGVVDHVIHAPSGFVCLLFHAFAQKE